MATGFVTFFGAEGASQMERKLDAVRLAIAAHVVGLARAAGYAPVLAVTPSAEASAALASAGAEVTSASSAPFHLGRELRRLVATRRLERVCVVGGGAGGLLRREDLEDVRARLEGAEAIVVSNNYYSADLVAFAPASALDAIDLPATDNPLPRLLHQHAGLPNHELPRGAASLFDVDTPTDATILLRHPRCPAPVREVGAWEAEQGERLAAILRLITTPEAELVVAGRVGAQVWAFLETHTACRVRMLAEERGMQAAGRDASGEARSVLGFLYAELGPRAFFSRMAELGQGMIFDSRVLFAHLGLRPTAAERFASDLFRVDEIADPRLREFTVAAADAPIPVLLGGHSVVGGGLWALAEMAWEPVAVS